MEIVIIICVCILSIIGVIWAISKIGKGSAGSLTSAVLGANDLLLSNEQKKAAEIIVEQNAGKKFEEQSSGEPEEPGNLSQ